MKRQRGRNRGGGGGGGKPQQQNANRAFDSNGPDGVKVRGNAQHVFEKYQQLARDAGSAGDRVLAENYLQHAEHYFRLLRAMQPQRPASEILGRDQYTSGFDIDFEDESGAPQGSEGGESEPGGETEGETRERNGWQGRDDRPREDRFRDDRPRDERPRDERPRDERPRDDRPRGEGRRDRWRDERPRGDRNGERSDPQPEREPMIAAEPAPAPPPAEIRSSPVLRDAEGGESHAPAFLQNRAEPKPEPAGEEEAVRRPRRRRAPRSFDGGPEGASPTSETEEV
jgi:hypothetical protein